MARGKRVRKVMMPKGAMAVSAKWEGTRGSYLTSIPPIDEVRMDEVEVFPIREPYTYGRVIYNRDRAEYVYEAWEPQLEDREKKLLDSIKDALNRTLEYDWEKMSTKDKEQYLKEAVESFLKSRGIKLDPQTREKLEFYITRDFDRKSPQAEQYRSLRTALKLVGQRKPFQTLLLTSLGPQEGKSTTVINLAFLFWELGHRVLVVDGDLRRGCLHRVFGVPRVPGITDLVLGKSDTLFPGQAIRPGLFLVPRGSKYDKPGVLLGSAGVRQAIALLRERADIILIDSSPLLPVSDALNLVSLADAVLLVVKAGHCSRREGARARQLLEDVGAKVLGLVLNEARDTGMRGPAHYPAGYYYEWDDEDLEQPARGTGRGAPEPKRAPEPPTVMTSQRPGPFKHPIHPTWKRSS